MMRIFYLLCALLFCAGIAALADTPAATPAATPPAAQPAQPAQPPKPTQIEGTNVEVVLPDGYAKSTSFIGFMNQELHASLMVAVSLTPYDTVLANYTKEKLAARNETLIETKPATFGALNGCTVTTFLMASNVKYNKLYAIFTDNTETVQMTGIMSETSAQQNGSWDKLAAAMLTARISTDLFAGKPYTLKLTPPLKFARRAGDGIMFTDIDNPADITQVLYLYAAKLDNGEPYVAAELARARLASSRAITDAAVLEEKDVKINGIAGCQLLAVATYKGTDKKCLVVLTILPAENARYFLIQGYVPAEPGADDRIRDEDRAKADILRAMTATLKRKKA